MLGIEDYGSDVDSTDETATTSSLAPQTSKSTLASTSRPKRTKKIPINLPSFKDDEDDGPPVKKPRIAPSTGAGKLSLLSMLPAPKRPVPVVEKKNGDQGRVLGSGSGPGLVFRTVRPDEDGDRDGDSQEQAAVPVPSTSFLPLSLKKGKANVSLETDDPKSSVLRSAPPPPSVDFFSLESSTSGTSTATPSTSSAPSSSASVSMSTSTPPPAAISSAPAISSFRPPSPTLDDPYPGYYQLPSGAYAPYEAAYYATYAKKWQADYDKHIRALEKSQYTPEAEGAQDVDMAAEMEKARREIKEREERKALTAGKANVNEQGEVAMPKMNVKGAKLGAVARSRHQLTTLLTEAYMNREALEEKIAQGRRNRKEAGNKYGF